MELLGGKPGENSYYLGVNKDFLNKVTKLDFNKLRTFIHQKQPS